MIIIVSLLLHYGRLDDAAFEFWLVGPEVRLMEYGHRLECLAKDFCMLLPVLSRVFPQSHCLDI